MMGRKTPAALALFLCLLGPTSAEVCFEPFSGDPVPVTEMQGSVCVNVVRDVSDSDVFLYRAVSVVNLDADRTALEDDDFTAVPSGAVVGDNPPRYQTVIFAPNSTTFEICVNIAHDLLACEEEEMFQIELSSVDACGGMNFTHLLVSIEDSTHITVKFTKTEVVIKEDENFVKFDVVRERSGARNVKNATLRVREDPKSGGCLNGSSFVTYGCQDFDCSVFDAFLHKTVVLPLLPDDAKVDGHKVCTVVMEGASRCKFSFTNGSKMRLVVEDDESITVSFNASIIEVQEDAGEVHLTLVLSVAVHQPFTVTLRTGLALLGAADATADVDFQSGDYHVTFQAGETTATATIKLIDDDLWEFVEDFRISIVEVPEAFYVITGPSLLVEIVDDESRNGRIRLVDGPNDSEGHVEVLISRTWGRVCDDMWDILDGNVVCRQLGFKRAEQVYHESKFGLGTSFYMWLYNLRCTGGEDALLECPRNQHVFGLHNCNPFYEAAGVRCTNEEAGAPPLRTVRLAAGPNQSEGRVEVFIHGQWGTICDDLWNLNNSNVVCRQLGFPSAIAAFTVGRSMRGEGSIWLDDVQCTGQEASLLHCNHSGIGENNCNHIEDAGVKCNVCTKSCDNGGTLDGEACTCTCTAEFTGGSCEEYTGGFCEDCVTKNCLNGGAQDPTTCNCLCLLEYTGELCETCVTKTCLNGGTQNSSTCDCVCPPEYTGEFCKNCLPKICENGATQNQTTCQCVCPPDRTGELCESCVPKACENEARQSEDDCLCVCIPGYTGEFCERQICERVCENGGTLLEPQCECACPPTYTGENCENCVAKICENGGTQNSSTCDCVCPPEYTGEFCETKACKLLCQNGGTLEKSSCSCLCPPEYTGEECERVNLTCPPTCTHKLCKNDTSRLCVVHGADSCGNSCGAVTTCKACYYSKVKRALPDGCDTMLSRCDRNGGVGLQGCLSKWGKCLSTRYTELYGKPEMSLKKNRHFKCFSPPC